MEFWVYFAAVAAAAAAKAAHAHAVHSAVDDIAARVEAHVAADHGKGYL